jgi:hypothetical protein
LNLLPQVPFALVQVAYLTVDSYNFNLHKLNLFALFHYRHSGWEESLFALNANFLVHLFPLIIDPSSWEMIGYEFSRPFLLTDVTAIRVLTFVHTYRRLLVQNVVLTTSPTRRKGT